MSGSEQSTTRSTAPGKIHSFTLPPADFDLEQTLEDLAEVRSRLRTGGLDAVAVVREGRYELERRGLDAFRVIGCLAAHDLH